MSGHTHTESQMSGHTHTKSQMSGRTRTESQMSGHKHTESQMSGHTRTESQMSRLIFYWLLFYWPQLASVCIADVSSRLQFYWPRLASVGIVSTIPTDANRRWKILSGRGACDLSYARTKGQRGRGLRRLASSTRCQPRPTETNKIATGRIDAPAVGIGLHCKPKLTEAKLQPRGCICRRFASVDRRHEGIRGQPRSIKLEPAGYM
jgi:hypothetical protein